MRHSSPRSLVHSAALLTSLVLLTASTHAQETTARLVKDANRTPGDFSADIGWVLPIHDSVVFRMNSLAHGAELWTSDGTAKGTRLLKDITPGPGGAYPDDPVAFGTDVGSKRQVAFRSQRDATGNEVWATDGTEAGTVQIYKSPTLEDNGEVRLKIGTPAGFFFEDIDWTQDDPYQVFFSDGTAAGTRSINPAGESGRQFSDPYGYTAVGPWCYFIGNEDEIWRSDGTLGGTTRQITVPGEWLSRLGFAGGQLFVEIATDFYSSHLWTAPIGSDTLTRIELPEDAGASRIEQMLAFGDELFFIRYDQRSQREFWATDGTSAGTRRIPLQHLGQGTESQVLGPLKEWQGSLYLAAANENGDHELWRTDGTPAGTRRIASFTPPETSLAFYETQSTQDFLYFLTSDSDGYHHLWRTKGDAASTRPVRSTPPLSNPDYVPQFAATDSGGIFFAENRTNPQMALWRLRGKTHGAIRLTKPEKTTATGTAQAPVNAQSYEMVGGKLLSFVNTGSSHELWTMKPDGKGARAIWKASSPLGDYGALGFHGITAHGAIFSYFDGADVRQVWITDGTKPGTRLLGDHGAAANGGYPYDFVQIGDTWFYSVTNHTTPSGASLWKTDGTPAGTTKVVTPEGFSPRPRAGEMVAFDNNLYLLATGLDGETGLWRSDGTTAGTVLVKDEWYDDSFLILHGLSVAGGELTFAITTSLTDLLWHSDGTTAGTQAVPYPHGSFGAGIYSPAVDINGAAIFQARKSYSSDVQLWRYDGDETIQLRDGISEQHVYPWYSGSRMQAVVGTQLFYTGLDNFISELWATDGTQAGTRQVKDINPGTTFASNPDEMLAVGNVLYFTAHDETHGTELWRSDGTEAGTLLVADIEPGPESSSPQGLKAMNGKLYFTAQRRDIGRELFVIDLPAN